MSCSHDGSSCGVASRASWLSVRDFPGLTWRAGLSQSRRDRKAELARTELSSLLGEQDKRGVLIGIIERGEGVVPEI